MDFHSYFKSKLLRAAAASGEPQPPQAAFWEGAAKVAGSRVKGPARRKKASKAPVAADAAAPAAADVPPLNLASGAPKKKAAAAAGDKAPTPAKTPVDWRPRQSPHAHDAVGAFVQQHYMPFVPAKLDRPERASDETVAFVQAPNTAARPLADDPVKAFPAAMGHGSTGLAALLKEGARPGGKHINLTAASNVVTVATDKLRATGVIGAEVSFARNPFNSVDGTMYMRTYRTRVSADQWRQLRNRMAGVVVCVNFLVALCAVLQSDGALLGTHDDGRYRGFNLAGRLRAALRSARPLLEHALERGRRARGALASEPVLDAVATQSAVSLVCDSVKALQATYQSKPEVILLFKIRKTQPLLVDHEYFNDTRLGRGYSLYAFTELGRLKSYGLPPAASRVTVRLQPCGRTICLTYQPDAFKVLAQVPDLTRAGARRLQISILPGEHHFVPAAEGVPAHYAVYASAPAGDATARLFGIDPGVRVAATMLDCNTTAMWESNDERAPRKMKATLLHSDRLKALATATRGRFAASLRRTAQRKRTQLKNFITEGHRDMASFFAHNADLVLFPHLPTQAMSKKLTPEGAPRRLNKMTTRLLHTWGHGRLRSGALANKLKYFPHCCILDADEAYTSKSAVSWGTFPARGGGNAYLISTFARLLTACNNCFLTHETLGGQKIFKCPTPAIPPGTWWRPDGMAACKTIVARDANATVGILARSIVLALEPDRLNKKAEYFLDSGGGGAGAAGGGGERGGGAGAAAP